VYHITIPSFFPPARLRHPPGESRWVCAGITATVESALYAVLEVGLTFGNNARGLFPSSFHVFAQFSNNHSDEHHSVKNRETHIYAHKKVWSIISGDEIVPPDASPTSILQCTFSCTWLWIIRICHPSPSNLYLSQYCLPLTPQITEQGAQLLGPTFGPLGGGARLFGH